MDIIRSILNQGSQGEQSELDKLLVLVDPVIHSDHHLREQYL